MKYFLSFFVLALLCACSDDDTKAPETVPQSKVLMLQVDYTTEVFEAGTEISIDESVPDFEITSTYQEPGDFGGVQLYSSNSNTLLFDGTIIWMGTGVMSYPSNLYDSEDFGIISEPVAQPSESQFSKVVYSDYETYPEDMDYASIWNTIDNLAIVKTYRDSNPEATVKLFLYTPSVGIGNPEEWDWLVFIKN